jgi:hypothetical protein
MYLSTSAGVRIDLFYCCDKLDKISFFEQKKSDKCASPAKKGCCKHQSTLLKIKDEQKTPSIAQFVFKPSFVYLIYTCFFALSWDLPLKRAIYNATTNSPHPPPPSRIIVHCVYRI